MQYALSIYIPDTVRTSVPVKQGSLYLSECQVPSCGYHHLHVQNQIESWTIQMHQMLATARVKTSAWRLVGKFRLLQCNRCGTLLPPVLMSAVSQHCLYRLSADLERRKLKWRAPSLWFRLTEQVVADSEMLHSVSLLVGLKKSWRLHPYTFSLEDILGRSRLQRNSWEQPVNIATWLQDFFPDCFLWNTKRILPLGIPQSDLNQIVCWFVQGHQGGTSNANMARKGKNAKVSWRHPKYSSEVRWKQ